MLEYSTVAQIVLGCSIASGVIGYTVGKLGVAKIEADISTIKGLLSGQQKVTILPEETVSIDSRKSGLPASLS